MMSTASGALIASATVANNDIWARLRRRTAGDTDGPDVATRSARTGWPSSSSA